MSLEASNDCLPHSEYIIKYLLVPDPLLSSGNGILPDLDDKAAVLPPTSPVCILSVGAPLLTYCFNNIQLHACKALGRSSQGP